MSVFAFWIGIAIGAFGVYAYFQIREEDDTRELHHDYQQQITDLLKRIRKLEKP